MFVSQTLSPQAILFLSDNGLKQDERESVIHNRGKNFQLNITKEQCVLCDKSFLKPQWTGHLLFYGFQHFHIQAYLPRLWIIEESIEIGEISCQNRQDAYKMLLAAATGGKLSLTAMVAV